MLKLIQGNCNKVMRTIKRNTIDTIITDPPYALKFMNKAWDYELPSVKCFKRMLRIAKPGAILLCFGGTRTFHRMACNIEDAGWTIKDCIMWMYGSGFPKSHNISKAIDKAKNVKQKISGKKIIDAGYSGHMQGRIPKGNCIKVNNTVATSKTALLWDGWGTGLKPAFEPIIVAMKPLDGTYAHNAEKWGVAGLNIDGGRIGTTDVVPFGRKKKRPNHLIQYDGTTRDPKFDKQGRWPANIILDEEAGRMLDEQSGNLPGPWGKKKTKIKHGKAIFNPGESDMDNADWQSSGQGASRFFYTAKASKKERNLGLEKIKSKKYVAGNYSQSPMCKTRNKSLNGTNNHSKCSGEVYYKKMKSEVTGNNHPTVKPLKLMEYLCKLTKTPTGGMVLDPFMGSGTTGMACKLTARHFIGIELEKEYCRFSKLRMKATKRIKPKHAVSKEKIFKV